MNVVKFLQTILVFLNFFIENCVIKYFILSFLKQKINDLKLFFQKLKVLLQVKLKPAKFIKMNLRQDINKIQLNLYKSSLL